MKIHTYLITVVLFLMCCSKTQENKMHDNPALSQKKEKHRPYFHFTPPAKWMNDPNGMVYQNGNYHLFYQHYPDSTVWGPMHWGHAISKDLVNWENLPIALYPDSLGYIFSGSAIVDKENTSGLGSKENPALVSFFTYHDPIGEQTDSNTFQTQGIAYSNDDGKTWNKYEGNPILKNPGIRDFRDPKVIWHKQTSKWIMALAAQNKIMFYHSSNLIDWELSNTFGENSGSHGGVWECPDLFALPHPEIPEKEIWVLLVSINPGGPNGGSVTQYFLGDFDGSKFTNMFAPEKTMWLDYGTDNYAGVTWSNIPDQDGRRLFIGWMSNWDYANIVPTETWRSAMTIPRSLSLKAGRNHILLANEPVKELQQLRDSNTQIEQSVISGEKVIHSDVVLSETSIEFDLKNTSAKKVGIIYSNALGEQVVVGYDTEKNQYYIDRTKTGDTSFSDKFPGIHTAPKLSKNSNISLRVFLDVASIEVFADGGTTVLTDIFFPTEVFNTITLFAYEGEATITNGQVYELNNDNSLTSIK